MSASPARVTALHVVTRVREREAFAHETLDAALGKSNLEPRDAAFATRMAYGTIACRGTLDEAIARFVKDPGGLEHKVADALAFSAYEILFARTPSRAAVSEGVELVRSVQPRAAGLANAVLRRLSESADDFPWGDPSTDIAALARLYGHPEWIARLWVDELGHDTAASIMAANNEPAPLFLAHMPFSGAFETAVDDLSVDGVEPSVCQPAGCLLAGSPSAAVKSRPLARRQVIVADAGAQFTAHAMRPMPGQSIIELGAGRGTKTLILAGLAHLAGGRAQITAVDLHAFKLEALRHAAEEIGAGGIRTLTADATNPAAPGMPAASSVDSVLVDAPCSGLGTLRRHPDRRWRALPQEIDALAKLGARLLATAASLVKPGGFVVYSTCTIARRENADVIAAFLASDAGKEFSVDPLGGETPEVWGRFVTPEGYFQSLPEKGGPDGHFVARLVRAG